MNITVGTDPEIFFMENGMVFPAGLVFNEQFGMDTLDTQHGSLIADGAALEFQPFPSLEPKEVVVNLRELLKHGLEMARTANKQLGIQPEVGFDLAWCEQNPSLGEFGCSPDRSAWGEECTPATIDASKHGWRYAGCHIHLGVVDDPDYFMRDDMITKTSKALDRTVGLASMVLSNNEDRRRRGIYGRPGIYRHQPWGAEYRTPSNVLLRSPSMMEFIFRLAQQTIELTADHYTTFNSIIPDDLVVQVLRGDDLVSARELYMRMANVFCLDKLPHSSRDWAASWFGAENGANPQIDYAAMERAIGTIDNPYTFEPVPEGGIDETILPRGPEYRIRSSFRDRPTRLERAEAVEEATTEFTESVPGTWSTAVSNETPRGA